MLNLFFGTHLIETFTDLFDEMLEKADVVAMENAYSNGELESEKHWNQVANGQTLHTESGFPDEEFRDGFLERLQDLSMKSIKARLVVFEKSHHRET